MSGNLNAVEEANFQEEQRQVESGVGINENDDYGNTVLHYAASSSSEEISECLVKHDQYLVEHDVGKNGGALHFVIKNCKEESLNIVKNLVEQGANVNVKDYRNKRTALHHAVEAKSLEIVKYLVEHGADVNCKTERRATALHFAVRTGSLEMAKYLVENGAKVTTKQSRGATTVLYWACKEGNESIVDFLLQHGAKEDIHVCDRFGRSCFTKACHDGNAALVRTFLNSGVNIRRQAVLLCRSAEIVNMFNLELKSKKHREKIANLKALDDKDLTQVILFNYSILFASEIAVYLPAVFVVGI